MFKLPRSHDKNSHHTDTYGKTFKYLLHENQLSDGLETWKIRLDNL